MWYGAGVVQTQTMHTTRKEMPVASKSRLTKDGIRFQVDSRSNLSARLKDFGDGRERKGRESGQIMHRPGSNKK